jgi:hypothetical protein
LDDAGCIWLVSIPAGRWNDEQFFWIVHWNIDWREQ